MSITLTAGELRAEIGTTGAELLSLRAGNDELIWQRDPAFWDRSAPVLFPVIGRLPDEASCLPGATADMPIHGFAPDAEFRIVSQTPHSVLLRLRDSASSRQYFPHEFQLDVSFHLRTSGIEICACVENSGTVPLHCAVGFHPGFSCDLSEGAELQFEKEETGPVYRGFDGRITGAPEPSPLRQRRLPITRDTFQSGAIIFPNARSRSVRLLRNGSPSVEVVFDTSDLAVWSKPGGAFVCIEPWCGLPAGSPESEGTLLTPGAKLGCSHRISIIQQTPHEEHRFKEEVAEK